MKLPFFSKPTELSSAADAAALSWPWPACCSNPKTLSFRANNDVFKTINSAYLDDETFSQVSDQIRNPDHDSGADEFAVVGALRSERLFFNPGESSSILEETKRFLNDAVSILALDSRDPYADFRSSMEEMVAAHGLKDWDCLEELLACYIRVNSKSNHGYILGAFVDLLVHLAVDTAATTTDEHCSSSSTATPNSFTSPLSFSSSTTSYSSASPRLLSPENEGPIAPGGENKVDCERSSSMMSANPV